MVRLCEKHYTHTTSDTLEAIFSDYSSRGLTLDHFQKYAIQAIEEGKHILVTAHTGSGKTLPAEYAIQRFCRGVSHAPRRRVIYTAPIKSLSNQKYHEFTGKYPDITFGIMTGDIKANPEADCVIMTTEILRNSLYLRGVAPMTSASGAGAGAGADPPPQLTFDFNPDEIACVIFDEVHYINDPDRGRVWEEVFMQLPSPVQCVMLSATIDRPESFASWVEMATGREVWVAGTDIRVVPLVHYSYFAASPHNMRDIKDRVVQTSMAEIDGKLCVLKDVSHAYNHGHIEKLHNIEKYMRLHHIQVKRHYVLNRVVSMLKERTMLPAICFVFSRRSAEEWAEEIEAGLFNEEDEREKIYPSIVEREAREILRKMPNYREYLSLPEFHRMMRLLQKGIAVHHSGVLPVLREMIELLFARGFIKLLFATETFAVGVNMPTKTVMFTALSKFDGRASFRNLVSHEYTQMAGRAGRRGLDTIGHVIHLNNLFEVPEHTAYQLMLSGRPQTFESRFRIDCGLVMRVASQVETAVDPDTSGNSVKTLLTTETIADFIRRSTLSKEITQQRDEYIAEAAKLTAQLTDIQMALLSCGLSETDMEAYADLLQQLELVNRRKRDRVQAQIDEFRGRYERDDPTMKLEDVFQLYKKKNTIVEQLRAVDSHIAAVASYVESVIGKILTALEEGGYIERQEGGFSITRLGRVASKIQEIPGMAVAKLVEAGTLNVSARELSAVLSIFTEVRVKDEDSIESWRGVECVETSSLLEAIERQLYQTEEMEIGLNMPYDVERYKCQYNIYDAIYRWCLAETEEDTRAILAELEKYGIFAGEFVKAILKIQNIVRELIEVAEMTENLQLKETLVKIPSLLLKFIATNQSLYV